MNRLAYAEHVALVKGDVRSNEPVLVRMHALNVLDDVLGDAAHDRGGEIQAAMQMVAEEGRGVVVLLREAQSTNLSSRLLGAPSDGKAPPPLRDYGVGAQILLDLGIKNMILLTNSPKTVVGLEGYGLAILGHRPIRK